MTERGPFTLVIGEPDPDDDPAAMAHLAAELGAILETANRVAVAARENIRRARGSVGPCRGTS